MKKLLGVSLLSTMLLLGQPIMAFADTTVSKIINFEDLNSIVMERNVDIQIHKNSNLMDKVDLSDIKKTIRDLEDELDDIDEEKDQSGPNIALNAEKRAYLDLLKEAERYAVDKPTLEAIYDLGNKKSDESIIRLAEKNFIDYNQLTSVISTYSSNIENLQKKLTAMELQASLGMVSHNKINELKTSMVDLQTQLESKKLLQADLEHQFNNLLNDKDNAFQIGSISLSNEEFKIEDQDGDLKKAIENCYLIKLKELKIITQQSALDRAKKDNGVSSKKYKKANYELTNSNLELNQLKDGVKLSYNAMLNNISNLKSELLLAQQTLGDKKVALSEAQLKMGLGIISKLELDEANKEYQVQENAVKAKQIDLFNAKCSYDWFLKGMALSN